MGCLLRFRFMKTKTKIKAGLDWNGSIQGQSKTVTG